MQETTQSSGSSGEQSPSKDLGAPRIITPHESIDDLTLIITHINPIHDPFLYGQSGTQALIDCGIFSNIYEHMAYHQSEVVHNGFVNDNNRCEEAPGDYVLYEGLKGKEFVMTGGCVGGCHYGAFLGVLTQKFHKKKKIHFPLDCMYDFGEGYGDGEAYPESREVPMNHAHFEKLYFPLLKLTAKFYSITLDGKLKESNPAYGTQTPQTDLFLWQNYRQMIDYIIKSREIVKD